MHMQVPPGATALRPLLEARGWQRLASLLDLEESGRGGEAAAAVAAAPWRGVWCAEHARAQLG